ncbi:hypothetical protein BXZ70DRAFT_489518 [Cristinia sonorae]|uniref:Uncharacterized protein n=1 Tax=Cristinia sonorae TaxID=1940300 RepID=A0A8K0XLJ2_9AGAR|nr:hypothetical protein BXZ70DRAFT_489518 [Cristinia sonorae]
MTQTSTSTPHYTDVDRDLEHNELHHDDLAYTKKGLRKAILVIICVAVVVLPVVLYVTLLGWWAALVPSVLIATCLPLLFTPENTRFQRSSTRDVMKEVVHTVMSISTLFFAAFLWSLGMLVTETSIPYLSDCMFSPSSPRPPPSISSTPTTKHGFKLHVPPPSIDCAHVDLGDAVSARLLAFLIILIFSPILYVWIAGVFGFSRNHWGQKYEMWYTVVASPLWFLSLARHLVFTWREEDEGDVEVVFEADDAHSVEPTARAPAAPIASSGNTAASVGAGEVEAVPSGSDSRAPESGDEGCAVWKRSSIEVKGVDVDKDSSDGTPPPYPPYDPVLFCLLVLWIAQARGLTLNKSLRPYDEVNKF